MIGLTPTETAAARAQMDALVLPETCTLRRRSAPGGMWADVAGAVDIACRHSPANGRDVQAASDVASRVDADAALHLPAATDVRRGDRARVSGEAGVVLCEVLWVAPRVRIHRSVLVRTVESA